MSPTNSLQFVGRPYIPPLPTIVSIVFILLALILSTIFSTMPSSILFVMNISSLLSILSVSSRVSSFLYFITLSFLCLSQRKYDTPPAIDVPGNTTLAFGKCTIFLICLSFIQSILNWFNPWPPVNHLEGVIISIYVGCILIDDSINLFHSALPPFFPPPVLSWYGGLPITTSIFIVFPNSLFNIFIIYSRLSASFQSPTNFAFNTSM